MLSPRAAEAYDNQDFSPRKRRLYLLILFQENTVLYVPKVGYDDMPNRQRCNLLMVSSEEKGVDIPPCPSPPLLGVMYQLQFHETRTHSHTFVSIATCVFYYYLAGKAAKEHAGNRWYRFLLAEHLQEYSEATTKQEKSHIVIKIMTIIRKYSKRGGFVKKVDGVWHDVGDSHAKEKVGSNVSVKLVWLRPWIRSMDIYYCFSYFLILKYFHLFAVTRRIAYPIPIKQQSKESYASSSARGLGGGWCSIGYPMGRGRGCEETSNSSNTNDDGSC